MATAITRIGSTFVLPVFSLVNSWAGIANITAASAASFQTGIPAKGSLAAVFCTGLTGLNGTLLADRFPLPLELGGVQVRIGGAPAPLLAVAQLGAYQQVNVQVPLEAEFTANDTEISIEQDGQKATIRAPLLLMSSSPGEFFRLPDGSGAFQHASDYSTVDMEHPAHAGEAVIGYLTGLSGTLPVVPTGQPAPDKPLAIVPEWSMPSFIQLYSIMVADHAVEPLFLGLTPGLAGVYQVNFVVPNGLSSGKAPVTLVGTFCSVAFGSCFGIFIHHYSSLPVPLALE